MKILILFAILSLFVLPFFLPFQLCIPLTCFFIFIIFFSF